MQSTFKNLVIFFAFQLVCVLAFAQEPVPSPPAANPKVESKQQEVQGFVEEEAAFPGGRAALNKFLADNMRYPQNAMELGIEGKCYLQFVVKDTGEITHIKVKKGVTDCPECDEEAIRIVKLMPKWLPGKRAGKPVDSYYSLPLTFRLD